MINIFLCMISIFIFLPILVYLCIKYGTVAFFKAKQFMKQENDYQEKENQNE